MSEPEDQIEEVENTNAATLESNSDSAEDKILDRLMGVESEEDNKPEVSEPQAVVEPVEKTSKSENPNRAKSSSILKRDGVPQSVIDATSDEQLEEWVAKASKRQKDVDGYAAKMKELEKSKKSTSEISEDDDIIIDDDEVEPSSNDETSDSETTDSQDDEVVLGKDTAKSLKGLAAEIAELKKAQQVNTQTSLQYQVEAADQILRYAYGNKSPEREKVLAEMNRLGKANPNSYPTVLQLAEEAYSNLAGLRIKSDPKRSSQPTVVKSVSRAERPSKPVDVEDSILDQLMDGKSLEEAKRFIRK